jgi:probable HAF family extracellular repeat protein
MSQDGSVVVGSSHSTSGYQAFRWADATGMVALSTPPTKKSYNFATAISKDGSVIIGILGAQAVRWTAPGEMVRLGRPRGYCSFSPRAVSGDGSVIVGAAVLPDPWWGFLSPKALAPRTLPFIWDNVNGMRNLESVLAKNYHLDLSGWKLTEVIGISADGKTTDGNGSHNGQSEGWVANLDRVLNEATGKARGK